MVLQEWLDGALHYANVGYVYNLGRYKFDSAQLSKSRYQLMNFRVAQWKLFREDVRDLFTLTTMQMGTYMTVGTLMLGMAVKFFWNGIKDFPTEPSWLMLFWGNTFMSSLGYGFLCVWLTMHGAVTADSSKVRCLAETVRPPIPTAEELKPYQQALEKYEAQGVEALMMPPDLLGLGGGSTEQRAEQAHAASSSSSQPGVRSSAQQRGSARTSQEAHWLSDHIGSPMGTGPGKAAEVQTHAKLFKEAQESFLAFDAYARVCLSGCMCQFLLSLGYFLVAYRIAKLDARGRRAAAVLCWGCTGMLVVVCLCIFKLDLWVEKAQLRSVKGVLVLGPFLSSLGAQMWVHSEHLQLTWFLVILSILLHIAFGSLFLYEARPMGKLQVPTSFRSIHYLDVLGSSTGAGALQRAQQSQASGLREALEHLLRAGGYAELLSEDERRCLGKLLRQCQGSPQEAQPNPSAASSPSQARGGTWWLRCTHPGKNRPCFVNVWTSTVRWEVPQEGHVISMYEQVEDTGHEDGEGEGVKEEEDEERTMPLTLRRPGSTHTQGSMPWKLFMQLTLMTLVLWMATLVFCITNKQHFLQRKGAGAPATRLSLSWPHEYFSPLSLACEGGTLFLGDDSGVFSARLPDTLHLCPLGTGLAAVPMDLEPLVLAEDIPGSSAALALTTLCGPSASSNCSSLFLLNESGSSIWEHQILPSRSPVAARQWSLGPSLGAALRTITAVEGGVALDHCRGGDELGWALVAATADGEAVVLCPRHGQLHPVRRMARQDVWTKAQVVHAGAGGILWYVEGGSQRISSSTSDAFLWASGGSRTWALPPGRRWARGICDLQGRGLLLAAEGEQAELWCLPPHEAVAA